MTAWKELCKEPKLRERLIDDALATAWRYEAAFHVKVLHPDTVRERLLALLADRDAHIECEERLCYALEQKALHEGELALVLEGTEHQLVMSGERIRQLEAQVRELKADSLLCPRCGGRFHDADVATHPDDYRKCPYCYTIEHLKCQGPMAPDREATDPVAQHATDQRALVANGTTIDRLLKRIDGLEAALAAARHIAALNATNWKEAEHQLASAQALADAQGKTLERLEWWEQGPLGYRYCLVCGAAKLDGKHVPNCWLDAILHPQAPAAKQKAE